MKKLSNLLQLNTKGDFGIEIEVEGHNLQKMDSNYWKTTIDNSLRGEAFEYVLKKPIDVAHVSTALKQLKEALKNSRLSFSNRTSTHVHVNVLDLTIPQYLNFIYTYLLLEEPMMHYCNKDRRGNLFCLRMSDAEGILGAVCDIASRGFDGIMNLNGDGYRYAAINIEATRKYGSLEFRGLHGTIDEDEIHCWTSALHNMRSYAKSRENPRDIMDEFTNLGPEDFINKVLGKDVAASFHYPKMIRDIQRNFSVSLDIPYAFNKEAMGNEKQGEADKNSFSLAEAQYLKDMCRSLMFNNVGTRYKIINPGVILANRIKFLSNHLALHLVKAAGLWVQDDLIVDEVEELIADVVHYEDRFE